MEAKLSTFLTSALDGTGHHETLVVFTSRKRNTP